jgi:TldD protein
MNNINRRQFVKNVGIGMGIAATSPMWLDKIIAADSDSVGNKMIQTNFGFTKEDLNKLLLIALSKGGDFSELYFEYIKNNSVAMEEGLIKSSSEYISLGVGVRVIKDNNYGYAHTSDLTFDK